MQALRYPHYRVALGISTLSWIGLWMVNIAVVADMLQDGRSVAEIGLFQGAWTIGVPLSVVAGGLITDRLGPTISLRLGLLLELSGILLMGVATSSADVALPPLLVAAFLIGSADGMTGVGLNVLAGGVVPPKLMSAAIGLLLLGLASGRIFGGTLAGPATDALGTSGALFACAGLVIVAMLLTLKVGRIRLAPVEVGSAYLDLRPAVRFYRASPAAVTVLIVGGLMAVLVYGYFSLLPVVVGETMGIDARSQGLAMAAGGFGVAVGAISMGPLSRRIGVGRVMVIAVLGSGLGLAGLGIAHTALVVLIAVTFLPTFTNVQNASANVLLQTMAPPGLRGRVVGLYSMVFSGLLPVGTVTVGWLGERFGVRETLFVLAGGMVLLTLALIKRLPTLRAEATSAPQATAPTLSVPPAAATAAPATTGDHVP